MYDILELGKKWKIHNENLGDSSKWQKFFLSSTYKKLLQFSYVDFLATISEARFVGDKSRWLRYRRLTIFKLG